MSPHLPERSRSRRCLTPLQWAYSCSVTRRSTARGGRSRQGAACISYRMPGCSRVGRRQALSSLRRLDKGLGSFVPLYFRGGAGSESVRPSIWEILKTQNTLSMRPFFSSSVSLSVKSRGFVKTTNVPFSRRWTSQPWLCVLSLPNARSIAGSWRPLERRPRILSKRSGLMPRA
jgi:hypothetical protein